MFKKAISLLLSLMLIVTSLSVTVLSVSAAGSTYVVAGVSAICGTEWDANAETSPDNVMTAKGDGTYEKVFTDVAVGKDYQIKVAETTADGTETWYGLNGGQDNITFNVTSVCDVTVTFDPQTLTPTVTGDGVEMVTSLNVESMRVAGNGTGNGNWLNGVDWDPASDENLMTEVEPGVYEITFNDIEYFDNYQVKFAANGSWAVNWGGTYQGSGVETDAVFNTNDNITVDVPYDLADVTIRLDITGFDYSTKQGAKFTVTVEEASGEEPVTTEPTEVTTEPTEETTTEPTVAPEKGLELTATSNYFPEQTVNVAEGEEFVTVSYFMDSPKDILNAQLFMYYDPEVLEYKASYNASADGSYVDLMPIAGSNHISNSPYLGEIRSTASATNLFKFNGERKALMTVTFKIIGSGKTTVDLDVQVLTLSKIDPDTFQTDEDQEEVVVSDSVVNTNALTKPILETVPYAGKYNADATNPVDQPTTEVTTEPTEVTTEPTEVTTEPTEVTTEPTEATTEPTEVTTEPTTAPTEPTTAPTEPTDPVEDTVYVVAGNTDFAGLEWVGTAAEAPENVMTANGDGTYSKVFAATPAMDKAQIQVVENLPDGTLNWIGDATGNNITFNVLKECDVTVTYNPATQEITVTGDGVEMVTELVVDSMRAAGNGDGAWLNGVAWDPSADENLMDEVADKIYSITYTVDAYDNYQVKFAANGSWADNWGGVFEGADVVTEAVYNSQDNITVEVPYELADVTLILDLTNFDYATKTGATFTVMIEDKSGSEPTEPTESTVETTDPTGDTTQIATEPTTEPTEPTTTVATALKVNATSNYFPANSVALTADDEYVTVTYFIESAKDMLNSEWSLKYDSSVLKFETAVNTNEAGTGINLMPYAPDAIWNNIPAENVIKGNCTSTNLYRISGKRVPFVTATFKVIGTGETTVDLFVDVLTLSMVNPDTFQTDPAQEELVVDCGIVQDTAIKPVRDTVVHAGLYDPDATAPSTEPTVTEPTEPTVTEPTEPTVTEPTEPTSTDPTDPTDPVGDTVYVVAGVAELCGVLWDGSPETAADNIMTDNGDGTYSKVFTAVAPMEAYQIKVVENLADGTQNWIGDATGNNITFNVLTECDVTVTYNPATQEITVTGDGVEMVTELVIDSMRTVGNGDGAWLNGVSWDPAADENLMTEVADKIYSITYTVDTYDNYQVKFAANGSWADNWGGVYAGSGVVSEAVYNGQDNITVDVPYELADVTIVLDLTNFDYATKTGATFTITVTEKTPETGLTVNATSNLFPEDSCTITESDDTDLVTVAYYFDSPKDILSTQWTLTYDPTVLSVLPENNTAGYMPFADDAMYTAEVAGKISGSCSDLTLYELADGTAFVQVTFKTLTTEGATTVTLNVDDLIVSEINAETGNSDEAKEEAVVVNGAVQTVATNYTVDTVVMAGGVVTPTEPTEPTATEPTEPTATEPTEPTATEPTEPTATEPTEPTATEPTEPTATEPTEPTATEPTEPTVTEPTSETTEPTTTIAPTDATASTDATSATGSSVGNATSDTTQTPGGSNNVQTGSASMSVIILAVLLSACGVLYFARKRVK